MLGFLIVQTIYVNIVGEEIQKQNNVIRLAYQRRNFQQNFHFVALGLYGFDTAFFTVQGFVTDHILWKIRFNDTLRGFYMAHNALLSELSNSRYSDIKQLYFMKNSPMLFLLLFPPVSLIMIRP